MPLRLWASRFFGKLPVMLRRMAAPLAARGLRIGASLDGAGLVHALGVRRGRVVWVVEAPLNPDLPLHQAFADVMATVVARARERGAPWKRYGRPRINVALPSALVQAKAVARLPDTRDTQLLRSVLQLGAGRFFRRSTFPIAIGRVRLDDSGPVWAAAFDCRAVAELDTACRLAGARLVRVLPAVSVLPYALRGELLTWRDGDWQLELDVADGRVVELRRTFALAASSAAVAVASGDAADAACGTTPTSMRADARPAGCVVALEALGEQAWRFAAAYGAATAPHDEALTLRPRDALAASSVPPPWRLAAAAVAAAVMLAAALFVPLTREARAAGEARAELARLGASRRQAVAVESELDRVTASLAALDAFAATRHSMTAGLAAFADVLPERAALVSLRVDTVSGTAVVLSRRATAVIEALRETSWLAAPELVGAVTRERRNAADGPSGMRSPMVTLGPRVGPFTTGPEELERATIRFRLASPRPAITVTLTGESHVRP